MSAVRELSDQPAQELGPGAGRVRRDGAAESFQALVDRLRGLLDEAVGVQQQPTAQRQPFRSLVSCETAPEL